MSIDGQHGLAVGSATAPWRHEPIPPAARAPDAGGSAASGPLPRFDHDEVAAYLRTGFWSHVGEEPRQFNVGATGPGANAGVLLYNVSDLTTQGARLAEQALEVYERVLDIDFVRTTSMGANTDIIFFDGGEGAYTNTYLHQSAETIGFSTVTISKDWLADYGTTVGSYSFQTYLHEIGHALGLGHAGPYNETANFVLDGRDPDFGRNSNIYRNDSWQTSMMSYFSQTENPTTEASFAFLLGPTVADWIALEAMYGPSRSAFAGDTVWGFNTNVTGGAYASIAALADEAAFTIIDRGGVDTVDFSGFAADQSIDLGPESLSNVGGLRGNMMIARGTVIENAVGGAGDDRLAGNGADNALRGGRGEDTRGRGGARHA
jgi:serralysin